MLLAIVLSLVALAFCVYFLHLFFQLNRSERKLQTTLRDVEASMLNRYGKPRPSESGMDEETESKAKTKPSSPHIEKKA